MRARLASVTPRRRWSVMCALVLGACTGANVRYEPLEVAPRRVPTVESTLYLVGDAGEGGPARDSVLAHLSRDIDESVRWAPEAPVVVAFLGDNIYDVGARPDFRDADRAQLTAQVDALGEAPNVRGVFVPGNHDWAKGAGNVQARGAILLQEQWLSEPSIGDRAVLLPDDACPGPATLNVGPSLHLVLIDTEWLLRLPDDRCGGADVFYERLERDLAENRDRSIVIAAHHPMVSGGPHGGNVGPFERGPLVYYLAVKSGLIVQDIASNRYSQMLDRLRAAIAASGAQPLALASGHDHSLQVIEMGGPGEPSYQLVSGSASHRSVVERVTGTRYATYGHGYMRLEFGPASVRLSVFAQKADGSTLEAVFACELVSETPGQACREANLLGGP